MARAVWRSAVIALVEADGVVEVADAAPPSVARIDVEGPRGQGSGSGVVFDLLQTDAAVNPGNSGGREDERREVRVTPAPVPETGR